MLIVEDERWEREGLLDFLDWSGMGIEIVGAAKDGIEGLELALQLKPDIVITDIKMPGLDGLELSKRIKEKLVHTRIVILTGFGEFDFARQAIQYSVSGYVLKPVEEEDMHSVISKVLRELDQDQVGRTLQRVHAMADGKRGGKDEPLIDKMLHIVEHQYHSPDISLKTVAAELFISPNYLGQLFRKATGAGFNEYLTDYRMNKAKELLQTTQNTAASVAAAVGIPNASYFSTVFKNQFGFTPGEFQETIHRGH
jgi:two-component system response regulator YesN